MTCFVPFNSKNLDISLFLFRPTIVQVDDLVRALKHFCLHTLPLGCLRSSIFKSIHGNMLIWYGAWVKRSDENKEILNATLVSMLSGLSSMAILVEHGFFDAFSGESSSSRTGSNSWSSSAAVFSTGDIVSLNGAVPSAKDDLINLSYACLALFKSCFRKMEGVSAGVCLRCEKKPRVVGFYVWKSLYACYNWVMNMDRRETMQPYIDHLSPNIKYDIFRVVYVSSDDLVNFQLYPPHQMLEYGGKNYEVENGDVMQEM